MKEKTAPRAADPLSREGLERELGRRFGTAFTKARAGALVVAFDRAADAVQAPSLADLLNRTLRGEPAALDALVRETSIGETYFFREIDGLERVVEVARRIFGDLPRPLTVWSAGCATGEEAYSLAMLFLEVFGPGAALQVVATDVNAAALARAQHASYGPWSFRNVEEVRKKAWFEPDTREGAPVDGLRPIEAVRSRVHFRPLNLAADDAPDNRWPRDCDLVVCRNVLVYFAPAAARLAARRFAGSLAPLGELVLASTDPPLESTALRLARHVPPVYVRAELEDPRNARGRTAPGRNRMTPVPRSRISPVPPSRTRASRRLTPPPLPPAATSPTSPTVDAGSQLAEAQTLADAGKYSEASALLDPLVTARPLEAPPRVLRAFVHLSLRHPDKALADADAALLLDPSVPLAHVVAALASLQLGDHERAQRSARNALGVLGPAADTAEHAELARTCRALLRPRPPREGPP